MAPGADLELGAGCGTLSLTLILTLPLTLTLVRTWSLAPVAATSAMSSCVSARSVSAPPLVTEENGNIFRVGILLDFASSSARAPFGAYVRMSGRDRIDPRWSKFEPLATPYPRA